MLILWILLGIYALGVFIVTAALIYAGYKFFACVLVGLIWPLVLLDLNW